MPIPDDTLKTPEEVPVSNNEEISILYNYSRERWNRNEIIIDDAFAYAVATQISKENDDDDWDTEPRSINECLQRKDWPKWENAIKAELESRNKRGVFGPIVQTPKDVNL
eukprot:TRINITY_DN8051_c1_g3_i5.p2 TRINITY_DN8051_c1_g3~~TRINITY_DN8051_c1_g3_i5.p2  ORF type:complete len:110 (+),score=12.12 TRINITY_DN8051_c1_g3_i5:1356-1685(+)